MSKRYSEMTLTELDMEIARLQKEGERSLAQGMVNELQILERKYYMAKSYLISPVTIPKGFVTSVENENGSFVIDRMEGVMAWGKFQDCSEERAFPVAMLQLARQRTAESK